MNAACVPHLNAPSDETVAADGRNCQLRLKMTSRSAAAI